MDLKITTLNANGIAENSKYRNIMSNIKRLRSDIILLQETHRKDFPDWEGSFYSSFFSNRSAGVAKFLPPGIESHKLIHSSANGRLLVIEITVNAVTTRLICVYAPNNPQDKTNFFPTEMQDFFSTQCDNIVAGDFNC